MSAAIQEFAQNLIVAVLNSLPVGIALALLTSILLRFTRRAGSSARFAVWLSALLALPLLAFLPSGSPGLFSFHERPGLTVPASWAIPALAVWATVAALILARIAVGIWRIRRIRQSCVPMAKEKLNPAMLSWLGHARSSRKIAVCTSNLVHVPAAIGFLKPAIVVPAWALTDLSSDQLAVILCHEMAHLRRWDDWSNLAQKILRALLFFHPAAWWIERELSLQREMACDDVALAHAASPRDYAQSLVVVAEKSMIRRGILLAQAAVHRARHTSLRIARLLKIQGANREQPGAPVAVVVAVLTVAVFLVEPGMPRLIAFREHGSTLAAGGTSAPAGLPLSPSQSNRSAQATVVPAAFHERPVSETNEAGLKQPVLRPGPRTAARKRRPAPELLVVFQNASFDQQGSATWNVYVVRVRWIEHNQLAREPSKKT